MTVNISSIFLMQTSQLSVTLEEIDSVDDFVARLERIELPNQIISSLQDPLLQKYLALNPDELAVTRMELWLSRYLNDELDLAREHLPASPQFSELLGWLQSQSCFAKV
jgi:centromere protein I